MKYAQIEAGPEAGPYVVYSLLAAVGQGQGQRPPSILVQLQSLYVINTIRTFFGRGKRTLAIVCVCGARSIIARHRRSLQVRDHNVLLELVVLVVGLGHGGDPWVGRRALAVLFDGTETGLL